MATKREQLRALGACMEQAVRACRSAADDLRVVLESMPTDRYRAQRELINRAVARLDAQAVAMEIEIGDPNRESVSAVTRLGSEWCMVVLTALGSVGSLTSAGIAIDGLAAADVSVRQAQTCMVEVEHRVTMTEFITDHVGPWHDEQADPPYPIPNDADVYLDFDGIWVPADGDGEPVQIPEGMPRNEWRLWREQYHVSEAEGRDDLLRLLDRWR